jgi:hypothetical protein
VADMEADSALQNSEALPLTQGADPCSMAPGLPDHADGSPARLTGGPAGTGARWSGLNVVLPHENLLVHCRVLQHGETAIVWVAGTNAGGTMRER